MPPAAEREHSFARRLRARSVRIGKAVTQEEVAEAAGISRVWYAMMENDRATRVSARVLDGLANILHMEPSERAALFRLALPELRSAALSERSAGMLDAFGSIRRFVRRLSGISSTSEALSAAREFLMLEMKPAAAATFRKNERGRWTLEFIDDEGGDRVARALELIRKPCGTAGIDDLHCLTTMTRPGELITQSDRDKLLRAVRSRTCRTQHYSRANFTCATNQRRRPNVNGRYTAD